MKKPIIIINGNHRKVARDVANRNGFHPGNTIEHYHVKGDPMPLIMESGCLIVYDILAWYQMNSYILHFLDVKVQIIFSLGITNISIPFDFALNSTIYNGSQKHLNF